MTWKASLRAGQEALISVLTIITISSTGELVHCRKCFHSVYLYSFHVMKENYRKAAHVMFECGSRLGLELVTVVGLKKQVSLTPTNNDR